jgi:hypothetical protein
MKTRVFGLIGSLLVAWVACVAQPDRSTMPGPGPAPDIAFPEYDLLTTSNCPRSACAC